MCSEIISIPGMIPSDRPQHIQGVQCSVKGLRMCKDVVRVSKKLLSLRYLQIFSDTLQDIQDSEDDLKLEVSHVNVKCEN